MNMKVAVSWQLQLEIAMVICGLDLSIRCYRKDGGGGEVSARFCQMRMKMSDVSMKMTSSRCG